MYPTYCRRKRPVPLESTPGPSKLIRVSVVSDSDSSSGISGISGISAIRDVSTS